MLLYNTLANFTTLQEAKPVLGSENQSKAITNTGFSLAHSESETCVVQTVIIKFARTTNTILLLALMRFNLKNIWNNKVLIEIFNLKKQVKGLD